MKNFILPFFCCFVTFVSYFCEVCLCVPFCFHSFASFGLEWWCLPYSCPGRSFQEAEIGIKFIISKLHCRDAMQKCLELQF